MNDKMNENTTMSDQIGTPMNETELASFMVTREIEVVVLSTLFSLIILGNLIVIFILLFYRKSRKKSSLSRMSFFIIHLSIADISVALMSILPQIIWRSRMIFDEYEALCKFVAFSQVFSVYASTFVLIVMAYDRYMCICWPIKSCTWTYKSGFLGVLVAWTLAAVVSSPQLFLFAIQPLVHPLTKQHITTCSVNWPSKVHEGLYIFFHMSTQFLIPLVVLIVLYTNIFLAVSKSIKSKKESLRIECLGGDSPSGSFSATMSTDRRSSSLAGLAFVGPRLGPSLTVRGLSPSVKRGRGIEAAKNSIELRPLNRDDQFDMMSPSSCYNHNTTRNSSIRFSKKFSQLSNSTINPPPIRQSISAKTLTKSKIKTLKLTLTVVIAYVLCTLPFYVSNIANFILDVSAKLHSNTFLQFLRNLTIVTTLLYQLNSCANPLIYMIFNGNAFKMIQKEKDLCCTGRNGNQNKNNTKTSNTNTTRLRFSGQDRTLQTELSEVISCTRNGLDYKRSFRENGR